MYFEKLKGGQNSPNDDVIIVIGTHYKCIAVTVVLTECSIGKSVE